MEMIKYKLKSNPNVSVDIPFEYAQQADFFVRAIPSSSNSKLHSLYPNLLSNRGIRNSVENFLESQEDVNSQKCQDIVYLRACVALIEDASRDQKPSGLENDLIQKIEELEGDPNRQAYFPQFSRQY